MRRYARLSLVAELLSKYGLSLFLSALLILGILIVVGARILRARGKSLLGGGKRWIHYRETFALGAGRFLTGVDVCDEILVLALTKTDVKLIARVGRGARGNEVETEKSAAPCMEDVWKSFPGEKTQVFPLREPEGNEERRSRNGVVRTEETER